MKITKELEDELKKSTSVITHHFLLVDKFPAILTDKDRFLVWVNQSQGYSDYKEFKILMSRLPPDVKTNLAYLAIFNKLEEFYKAHENKTLWKLLPTLPVSESSKSED